MATRVGRSCREIRLPAAWSCPTRSSGWWTTTPRSRSAWRSPSGCRRRTTRGLRSGHRDRRAQRDAAGERAGGRAGVARKASVRSGLCHPARRHADQQHRHPGRLSPPSDTQQLFARGCAAGHCRRGAARDRRRVAARNAAGAERRFRQQLPGAARTDISEALAMNRRPSPGTLDEFVRVLQNLVTPLPAPTCPLLPPG